MQFESFGKYQSTELHSFLLSAVSNFSDDDGGDYVVSGDYDHDDDNEDDNGDDGKDNLCGSKVSCRGARLNPLPGCWLMHLQRIRLLCFDALMMATMMMIMLALEMTVTIYKSLNQRDHRR